MRHADHEVAEHAVGMAAGRLRRGPGGCSARMAIQTTIPASTAFAQVDLKVNYLRPVASDSGLLHARAQVAHRGRSLAVATAEIVDDAGRRVALATAPLRSSPDGRPRWGPASPNVRREAAPAEATPAGAPRASGLRVRIPYPVQLHLHVQDVCAEDEMEEDRYPRVGARPGGKPARSCMRAIRPVVPYAETNGGTTTSAPTVTASTDRPGLMDGSLRNRRASLLTLYHQTK